MAVDLPAPDRAHRWTLAEFERACRLGVWPEDERIELLDGWLVDVSPISPTHAEAVQMLTDWAYRTLDRRDLKVYVQSPYRSPPRSRPEPDLLLAPSHARGVPEESVLLVEVAVSTRRIDLGLKRQVYAASGVPEYWVVQPVQQVIRVHREPVDGDFVRVEDVQVATFDGVAFDVRALPVLLDDD